MAIIIRRYSHVGPTTDADLAMFVGSATPPTIATQYGRTTVDISVDNATPGLITTLDQFMALFGFMPGAVNLSGTWETVANLAALAALDPSIQNTVGVIVQTLPATQPFLLNASSTVAPDGITTVAAIGGGNWERQLANSSPSALEQAAWFIDPVGGSDENDGLTALTALLTVAELFRRWGPSGRILTVGAVPCIITLLSDLPSTDPIDTSLQRVGPGQLIVFTADDAAILASGTVLVATPQVPAANTPWTITGAAAFNFVPHLGKRLRITGGPNAGTTCTIIDVLFGGTTAVLDAPVILPGPTSLSFGITPSTISGGDAFDIVDQVKVEVDQITMTSELDVPSAGVALVVFDNLEIGGNNIGPNIPIWMLHGCKTTAYLNLVNGTLIALGTNAPGTVGIGENAIVSWHAGSGQVPTTGQAIITNWGQLLIDGDTVLYGGGLVLQGGFAEIAQLAVFNAVPGFLNTGAGIAIETSNAAVQTFGSVYGPSRIWGATNAMGISVPPGGTFDGTVASAKTITGLGGDFQLATKIVGRAWNEALGAYTAAIGLSWANLVTAIGLGGFGGIAHDVGTNTTIVG